MHIMVLNEMVKRYHVNSKQKGASVKPCGTPLISCAVKEVELLRMTKKGDKRDMVM